MNKSKMRALFAILCILIASTLFIPTVSMAGGRQLQQPVDFLDDVWVPSLGSLRPYVLDISQELFGLSFSDFMDGNDNWDLPLLFMFSPAVVSHIISITCLDSNDIADKPLWRMATSHSFSISSAYESLVSSLWDDKSSCWKCFWTQPVPQRLRFFLWLSFKKRLMTNVEHCRRFIGQNPICPCFHMYVETTAHVLRDC
ncbi:hypothetical protein V6N12_057194 [Hibiscus sabdariffa]|uniref:Reverse transcriptase zinc-binding domain-containing protein n=1 Tax=Hibiscus sabdariffa TaxID=183260 RepID=A0ABR1ZU52_9ROSI